jgi:hypothetical protein
MRIRFPNKLRILLEYVSIQNGVPKDSILIESFNLYLEKYRNLLIQYPSYKELIKKLDSDPYAILNKNSQT